MGEAVVVLGKHLKNLDFHSESVCIDFKEYYSARLRTACVTSSYGMTSSIGVLRKLEEAYCFR